jgi:hypothetical protein
MNTTEELTLVGISITLSLGIVNLIYNFRKEKHGNYINSITSARISYLKELRLAISNFCGAAISNSQGSSEDNSRFHSARDKELKSLGTLIKLFLTPTDNYWDKEIQQLADNIMLTQNSIEAIAYVGKLITISQYLVMLEWAGIKEEAANGELSIIKKEELNNKFIEKYKNHKNA